MPEMTKQMKKHSAKAQCKEPWLKASKMVCRQQLSVFSLFLSKVRGCDVPAEALPADWEQLWPACPPPANARLFQAMISGSCQPGRLSSAWPPACALQPAAHAAGHCTRRRTSMQALFRSTCLEQGSRWCSQAASPLLLHPMPARPDSQVDSLSCRTLPDSAPSCSAITKSPSSALGPSPISAPALHAWSCVLVNSMAL